MHLALATLLFSTTQSAMAACDGRVSGHLVDAETGAPVPHARVEIDAAWAESTDDGRFVIRNACTGPAELHVHHPSYLLTSATIEVPVEHLDLELDPDVEVIVVEASRLTHGAQIESELSGEALERTRGQDLGESLAGVAGVTTMRTSGDATRPMIRGLYGRRLVILNDGMRLETQKWGDEHAPEIDPLSASSITVVHGPSGVRYGPDAIGGVVKVDPPRLRSTPGVGGRLDGVAVSNGARGLGGFALDAATNSGLAVRLEGNISKGGDLSAPGYVLANTASETSNLAVTGGVERDQFSLVAGLKRHAFDAGICACVRKSSPEVLLASLEQEVPLNAETWTANTQIERPMQRVRHTLAFVRAEGRTALGTLDAAVNVQVNRRQEFETARETIETPQYDFTLRTTTVEAGLSPPSSHLTDIATLASRFGATLKLQDNVFAGLPLVPNHRAVSAGAYVIERVSIGHSALEAGARVDHQSRTTFLGDSATTTLEGLGKLPDCEQTESATKCPQSWTAGSASLGGIWHDRTERVEGRLDLSSASRFPDGDELFLAGAAPTQPVFGLGDPTLTVETTWGGTATLGLELDALQIRASAFGSWVDDAITFRPVRDDSGQPAIDVTVRGAFPRYAFTQGDAWRGGMEAQLTWLPHPWFSTAASVALVRAVDIESKGPLPFVPADHARLELRVHPQIRALHGSSVAVIVDGVAPQTRWSEDTDLGPPPDGYALLGLSADLPIDLDGPALALGVEVQNLLNTPTRSYTSLLRYFADDPGRELRARASFTF